MQFKSNRLVFYSLALMVLSAIWWAPSYVAQRLRLSEVNGKLIYAQEQNEKLNKEVAKLAQLIDGLIEHKSTQSENPFMKSVMANTPSVMPTVGEISSPFGNRRHPIKKIINHHNGIDIKTRLGEKVIAAANGKVKYAGFKKGYGNVIELEHLSELTTIYGHLQKILVKKGDQVKKGDVIGKAGRSGTATGPHLHFEVRHKGKPLNAAIYMDPKKQSPEALVY